MTTTNKPEKLSLNDHILNATVFLAWPMFAVSYLTFWYSINKHKSKDSKGPAWPTLIEVEAIASNQPPAGVTAVWDSYGIQSCFGADWRAIQDGKRVWLVKFYVSNFQHWVAYRHAIAFDFVLTTPSPVNQAGVSAADDAKKGRWKAWAVPFRPKTWDQWLTRAIGDMVGTRGRYLNSVRAEPGIRAAPSIHTTNNQGLPALPAAKPRRKSPRKRQTPKKELSSWGKMGAWFSKL